MIPRPLVALLCLASTSCLDFSVDRYCEEQPALCSPSVAKLEPTFGASAGGTAVTISGMGFDEDLRVIVGGVRAERAGDFSPTQLFIRTPPHAPGKVDVELVSGGDRIVLPQAFEYDPPPHVSAFSPAHSVATGGGTLVIDGSNFVAHVRVLIGRTSAAVSSATPTRLVVTFPPHAEGLMPLEVINDFSSSGPVGDIDYRERWWVRSAGLTGITLAELAVSPIDPARWWVTVDDTVFSTSNSGATWTNDAVGAHRGLFGGHDGALYALDDGTLWRRLPGQDWRWVMALQGDAHSFADGRVCGFYYWRVRCRLPSGAESEEALPSGTTGFTGNDTEQFVSRDYDMGFRAVGATAWTYVSRGPSTGSLVGRPSGGVYSADGATGNVYRYDGAWTLIRSGAPFQFVAVDPSLPGHLALWSTASLERTTDDGASWETVSGFPPSRIRALAASAGKLVATGDGLGVLAGTTTLARTTGTFPADRYHPSALALDPADPDHLLAITQAGLHSTTNGGVAWTRTADPALALATAVAFAPSRPGRAYAATPDGLLRSDDGGTSWTRVGPSTAALRLSIDPLDGDRVLVAANGSIWSSDDGGASWTSDLLAGVGASSRVGIAPASVGLKLVATGGGRLLAKSGDGPWLLNRDDGFWFTPRSVGWDPVTTLFYAATGRGRAIAGRELLWSTSRESSGDAGDLAVVADPGGGAWLFATVVGRTYRGRAPALEYYVPFEDPMPFLDATLLATRPGDPDLLYVATETHGIWRTAIATW